MVRVDNDPERKGSYCKSLWRLKGGKNFDACFIEIFVPHIFYILDPGMQASDLTPRPLRPPFRRVGFTFEALTRSSHLKAHQYGRLE